VLVPPISSTACCATRGTGGVASSSFWAASISSRTQVAGAISWGTLPVDSCYFANKRSANSTRRGRWPLLIPGGLIQLDPVFHANRAARVRQGFSKRYTSCFRRAWGGCVCTEALTPTEEVAIFRLDQLNGSKFFNFASLPRSLDARSVETISGIRAGDGSCGCFLVCGSRGSMGRDKLPTRSI